MSGWPTPACPVCGAPPSQRVLLGALRCYECLTIALEGGEYSPGKNCVDEELPDATQAKQSKASAKVVVEPTVPGKAPKKTRNRKPAGVPEVPARVRRKRAS